MHEKKTSNGVIRIRMNTCTILALIILPFLLFMLYVILFSECSDLLRKSGLYTSFNKTGNESYQDIGKPEENIDKVNVVDDAIYLKSTDDKNLIGSSGAVDTDQKIPTVFQIINLLFLLPMSEENISPGNQTDGDKITGVILTDNAVSHPGEDWNAGDALTSEKPEGISGGEMLLDYLRSDEQKDQTIKIVNTFNPNKTTDEIQKSEKKGSNDVVETGVNDNEEFDSFFGPLRFIKNDSWNFKIDNTVSCSSGGKDLYLLILIHSYVPNFDQRKAIRETWGRLAKIDGINYSFITGVSDNSDFNDQLERESNQYKDIIQTNLVDFKVNDTAKSVLSFKWLIKFCPTVKYVFKTQDNVFVNLPQLVMFLQDKDTKDDVMYGYLFEGFGPERDPAKPDYISRDEYAGDVYPNYLASKGYIFPGKFSPMLYISALKMKYSPVENIFITGFLAEELKIPRVDVPLFSSTFPDLPKTDKCEILSYIIVFHPLNSQGLRFFWDDLKRTGFKCGNFMESVSKMLPKNESMYSNFNNEKLLYALLTGESAKTIDDVNNKETSEATPQPLLIEENRGESEISESNGESKHPDETVVLNGKTHDEDNVKEGSEAIPQPLLIEETSDRSEISESNGESKHPDETVVINGEIHDEDNVKEGSEAIPQLLLLEETSGKSEISDSNGESKQPDETVVLNGETHDKEGSEATPQPLLIEETSGKSEIPQPIGEFKKPEEATVLSSKTLDDDSSQDSNNATPPPLLVEEKIEKSEIPGPKGDLKKPEETAVLSDKTLDGGSNKEISEATSHPLLVEENDGKLETTEPIGELIIPEKTAVINNPPMTEEDKAKVRKFFDTWRAKTKKSIASRQNQENL